MLNTHRRALAIAMTVALSGSLLIGCSGKEERQAKYLHRAQEYLDKKDYDKARIEAKNVLQINANNAEARYIFAEIAEHENDFRRMYGELNAAIDDNPKLLKAHVKLAQLLVVANQLDKAEEEAKKIHDLDPNNADYYSVKAGIAMRRKNADEAVKDAEKALQIQPGNLSASALLASYYADKDPEKSDKLLTDSIKANPYAEEELRNIQVRLYVKQNEVEKAITGMKKLIDMEPDKSAYVAQLAAYYASESRPDDAKSLLEQSIKDHPDNTDFKLALVEFTARQHKADDAVALLQQYLKAEPDNYKLRKTLAQLYLVMKQPDQAIATYQYTIDKNVQGEGIDARNHVIEILLSQNKRPEAEKLLKDVLKLEPENPVALMTRARLELSDNKADNAIADLRSVLKNAPDSIPALDLLATAQERSGSISLALDNYKKVLDKNANDLPALLGAARLEIRQNKLDDAQKLLEHARSVAGTNTEVARLLVDIYARKQQWDQALELCDQLTLNSNTAAIGYYLKGLVQLQKKDTNDGIESLKKALEKEPRAVEPLQMLISAYVTSKQEKTATTYLNNFVKEHPELIHAQELQGALYRQTGKLSQAKQVLEEVVKKAPKRVSAYRELMAVYMDEKQPQKIKTLFANALQNDPDNADLLLLQAQYAQTTGDNKLALDSYEKALKLQPDSKIIKNNLAVLLMDKFPSDANLQRAQDLVADFDDSKNPLLVDTYAWLQYKMGNYQQTISLLNSVLDDKMHAPELHYHLGMAYLKSGNKDQAKTELSKAIDTKAEYSGKAEAESELKKL